MNKHDDFLTNIVYEIDDIVYEYYRKTNEVIAQKRDQERLIDYRDKTIDTINDMNVRSLEIIAAIKSHEMVETRANILIERNQSILESSWQVITSAANRSEFLEDIASAATQLYEGAKKTVRKVEQTDTFHKVKESAADGYVRLRDAVENISSDPRVQEGIKIAKETTKDVIHAGEKVMSEGGEKLKSWIKEAKEKSSESKEKSEDTLKEVVEEVQEMASDLDDKTSSVVDEALKQIDDLKEKVEREMGNDE